MNTRNDRDLHDLLGEDAGRIGASYRKLGKLEPPRRLDRNVLAEASRAVHGRPRASRWLIGVGTAAGVLLAAGIGWRVNHDMAEQREAVPMSAPASKAAPAGVIRVEPRADSSGEAKYDDNKAPAENQPGVADAETATASISVNGTAVERKAGQAKQKLDKDFVPDPAPRKSARRPAQATASKQEEIREQTAPMSPAAQPQSAAAAPMQAPTPAESPPAQSLGGASEAEPALAPAPMQKAVPAQDSAADSASTLSQDGARRERSSSATNAAAMTEIDRIRALLRAGQRDAALEALRQLRREHPDLVLPADLQVLGG